MTNEKQGKITATVTSYGQGLRGFIRKRVNNDADAEDILQDVWYQLSAVINTRPVEQLGAWLYRVAKNRIIDKRRKKSELTWNPAMDADREGVQFGKFTPVADDNPETAYQDRMAWQQLWRALDELPPAQRQVFVWHELEQLSFAEIAEITGESMGKLISRKHYAVVHLRKRLKIFYDELTIK
ncbi:RNA polymerase sigma factor [Parapedobacter indicus]|uniref:RNA polymerase sigma factor, sigma-70 family n=1 Tax=Parapedobacter indicus TaxID=1477437 RepID=A0A1I3QNV6_9SPHI|nr:sigma-70 family RNA polymerase sigma factor [Parapedobacter indicus]PPL00163.1 RNA polymerase sigma factor (sigma-70 family) [Parapedobacter indicus]SFJ34807.1 RNA polymerase sigma factor, sigma-70 family [Parapedobacter indicus]